MFANRYTRQPFIILLTEEIEGHATSDERVLGVVTRDRIDHDFGGVALGRDEQLRIRAVAVNASLPGPDAAREQLFERMDELAAKPNTNFHQGDSDSPLSTSSLRLSRPIVSIQPSAS